MNETEKTRHLPYLQTIADADVAQLGIKDREYGASWKTRGGVGAFMMCARKWDRMENMVRGRREYKTQERALGTKHSYNTITADAYDIFAHAAGSEAERGDAESLLDTIGDLRRYLLLIEAEIVAARPGAVAPGKAALLRGEDAVHEALAPPEGLPKVEREDVTYVPAKEGMYGAVFSVEQDRWVIRSDQLWVPTNEKKLCSVDGCNRTEDCGPNCRNRG